MGRDVQWYGDAWDEYCEWQRTDKAILKRINELIVECRPVDAQQFGLLTDGHFIILAHHFQPFPAGILRHQIFFEPRQLCGQPAYWYYSLCIYIKRFRKMEKIIL